MSKILLVEDNEMNRDALSRLLARRGYEILFAEDGEAAVAMTRSALPDLVLMDISLPRLDGYEATRHLRALEATRNIPIIALTAHAMTSDRELCMAAGCTDFESKPVDFARLLGKIQSYLGAGLPA